MKNAVASGAPAPSTTLPWKSQTSSREAVISWNPQPYGLTRNSSSDPGTIAERWLQMPSCSPSRLAAAEAGGQIDPRLPHGLRVERAVAQDRRARRG